MISRFLKSSIGRKQIIAVSGLAMVGFLLAHLSGNFLIFKGPEALNDYSDFLHSLGGLLWVARAGLIAAFVAHFGLVFQLVLENRRARGTQYATAIGASTRNFATKTMRYSGLLIFIYIFWHLYDFTYTPKEVYNSTVNGEFLGLYGLVWNSFLNPIRSIFYIVTMIIIGFHLNHGIASTMQTFGFNHPTYTPLIQKIGATLSVVFALGYSSIPIYVIVVDKWFM